MKDIPTTVVNCLKRHEKLRGLFGEIYFTSKWRLILHCTFCAQSFDTILAYKKHARSKHENKSTDLPGDCTGPVQEEEEEEITENCSEKIVKPTDSDNVGRDPLEENENENMQTITMKIERLNEVDELIDSELEEEEEEEEDVKVESGNNIEVIEFINQPESQPTTFKCSECNQTFEQKNSLNNHKRIHSKRLKHACTICHKKFSQDNDFKMHILWHSGGRPYICSWCGKDYRTVRALHIHERLHTNTRPYKCPYCDRDFYKNRHLKEHVVTHTRERNHMCPVCNSSFPRRKALKSHMKIHENKREHICNICNAAYNQRPALYFHMKNKHNVLPLTSITSTDKNKTTTSN